MDNLSTISEILRDVINIEVDGLSPEMTFDSLGLDSLDAVELAAEVEEHFDVELSDVDTISTIGDLLDRLP